MIKLLGSILIIGSVVFLFYQPMIFLKRKIQIHFLFITLFHRIRQELKTNLWAIPELLCVLSDTCDPSLSIFLTSIREDVDLYGAAAFCSSWKKNLSPFANYFSAEETYLIEEIGNILGQYTLDEQMKTVDEVICALDHNYQNNVQKYQNSLKLNVACGSAVGIMITVLLV